MKKWNVRKLVLSILACEGAGIIGSFFTFPSIPTWYASLVKPSFSPPNWLFGPVWTILYLLMGISMYLIWKKKKSLKLFLIHLGINTGWSIVFFGLHSIVGGLVVIMMLWSFIFLLIKDFYRIQKAAAYLLMPYLVWVSFASLLNLSLLLLNR